MLNWKDYNYTIFCNLQYIKSWRILKLEQPYTASNTTLVIITITENLHSKNERDSCMAWMALIIICISFNATQK